MTEEGWRDGSGHFLLYRCSDSRTHVRQLMTITPRDPTHPLLNSMGTPIHTCTHLDTHASVDITGKGARRLHKPEEVVNIVREMVFGGGRH